MIVVGHRVSSLARPGVSSPTLPVANVSCQTAGGADPPCRRKAVPPCRRKQSHPAGRNNSGEMTVNSRPLL